MLSEPRWHQELLMIGSWAYMPGDTAVEIPVGVYLDPEKLLILYIDLYGDRALEMIEREAELCQLDPRVHSTGFWHKYVWLDLKRYGFSHSDIPSPPVLTAEETADTLNVLRGHSGAITYAKRKVEFYRELAGVLMTARVDSEALDLHQHWHQVFKLLTGIDPTRSFMLRIVNG